MRTDQFFKGGLIGVVNPNLLERLWRKSDSTKPILFKSEFGVTLMGFKTPLGECWTIPHKPWLEETPFFVGESQLRHISNPKGR